MSAPFSSTHFLDRGGRLVYTTELHKKKEFLYDQALFCSSGGMRKSLAFGVHVFPGAFADEQ